MTVLGFPCGSAGKESACNAGDMGSILGWGRFPWRRKRLPTSLFWPGGFHGLYSPWGRKESDTTEQLSLMAYSTKAGNCSVARSRCLENNLEFTQLALPLGIK